MYDSNPTSILLDDETKSKRTEIVRRLYGMGFNVIPMNGKKPCVEWKPYQARQVTADEIKEWMGGRFPTKEGTSHWRATLLNFALLTGAAPWSDSNPGIVVIDSDDEEADEIVRRCCPPTPMTQVTGRGGLHRLYRRPSIEAVPYIANRQKTWVGGKQYNLDVRADGGYIMAPGSIHPTTGMLYREEIPWTLELLLRCPVYDPAWLPCEAAERFNGRRSTVVMPGIIDAADHDEVISKIGLSVAERERQARIYLDAVSGTQEGTGADRSCTALIMRLLHGFALPADSVLEMLTQWGQRQDQLDANGGWYPWTEKEISRKIEWCLRHKYDGEVGDRLHACRGLGEMETGIDEVVVPFGDAYFSGSVADVIISPADQLGTAAQFFNSEFDSKTLVHHQGCWYHWNSRFFVSFRQGCMKSWRRVG